MTGDGIQCMQMRGGSSKGAYFLSEDLLADLAERDDLLLRIMGSPDERQIDGIGGGHPLTSKVAVIAPSASEDADVDYLFLRGTGDPRVSRHRRAHGPQAVRRPRVPRSGKATE